MAPTWLWTPVPGSEKPRRPGHRDPYSAEVGSARQRDADGTLHRDSGVQSGSAGLETGEDSQVRSEEEFSAGNQDPLTYRLSPTSRCRDAALPAEGRICPVGPPALSRALRARCLRLGFSPPLPRPRPRRREKAAQAQPRELEAWGLQEQGAKGM